jgi:circadian clock protein KaiB
MTGDAASQGFDGYVDASASAHYVLRLYVTGMTPRSTQALAAIRSLCDRHLAGRYDLEVIDIYQHPERAVDDQIIAAPTLVEELPAPLRRLVGDLSDTDRVMIALDLGRDERG